MIRVKMGRVVGGGNSFTMPVMCRGCGKSIRRDPRCGEVCPTCRMKGRVKSK